MRLLYLLFSVSRLKSENRDLKARVLHLEAKLEAQEQRHIVALYHANGQVLTAAGRFGYPKSVDPPQPEAAKRPPRAQELTGIQRATIEALKAEGEALGRSPIEIEAMIDAVRRGETMPVFEEGVDGYH